LHSVNFGQEHLDNIIKYREYYNKELSDIGFTWDLINPLSVHSVVDDDTAVLWRFAR